MQPFSLVCPSCTARLKVTQATAIGQLLGCPKCGTMIHITPPAGHVVPTAESSTDFDDIDSILGSEDSDSSSDAPVVRSKLQQNLPPPRQSRATPQPPANEPQETPHPRSEKPSHVTAPSVAADDWTSNQVKQRRRMAALIAGGLATLLLLGVIAIAITQPAATPEPAPANPVDDEVVVVEEVATPAEPENVNDEPENVNDEPENVNDEPELVDKEPPSVDETPLDSVPDPPASGDATTETPVPPNPDNPIISDAPPPIDLTINSDTDPAPGAPEDGSPASPIEAVDTSGNDSIGNLSQLLEESGISILEIQDTAAAERDRFGIGLARYFIEPTERERINVDRVRELKIGGVKYDELPLSHALEELSTITGLAISHDAIGLSQTGASANPVLSFIVRDLTVDQLMQKIAESVNMISQHTPNGYELLANLNTGLETRQYSIGWLPAAERKRIDDYVELIKTSVWPGTWTAVEDDPAAAITVAGDQLTVTQQPYVLRDVDALLAALQQNVALNAEPNDELARRWPSLIAGQGSLGGQPNIPIGIRRPLRELFLELDRRTGVCLLADWTELFSHQWTPDSLAPGRIQEPTVLELSRQLAHSMELTTYVIDSQHVLLTPFEKASAQLDLRVYPIEELLARKLTRAQIERLIAESLGGQMLAPGVRAVIVTPCRSLVVRGPQSVHRQIESIIARLSQ